MILFHAVIDSAASCGHITGLQHKPSFCTLRGDDFRSPVQSDIPVLCISGEMDVRTPPSNAQAVLEGLPNGQHVIIARAGHDDDLLISSPKIAQCIISFFKGEAIPFQRIDLPPIDFSVP